MNVPTPERAMSAGPFDSATNPTIFLRLNEAQSAPREFAWDEFGRRYAPVITAFLCCRLNMFSNF